MMNFYGIFQVLSESVGNGISLLEEMKLLKLLSLGRISISFLTV